MSGLDDDSEYKFKVRARNASGFGAESNESDGATPSAVTLSADTATAAGMTLKIADYTLAWYYQYTSPSGGTCSSTAVPAGTSSKAVTGLDSNTAYTFKAYSDSGCSAELASASSYATLPPKPAKPTLTVNVGDGKVKLASSVTGTAALTKWQYKKSKDGGDYDADWTDISSTSKTLSHTVSGLDDGSAYKFKVRARNASGFGAESDESDAATPRAVTLTAGTATATGMTLTIANWSGAWRYEYTSPTGGQCSSEVAAGTDSATVGSLDSNTAYTFKAYSDNSCGTELAAASPVATLPPKPAKPTATAGAGSGKLVLASSVTGTATLTKWQYKKSKDGGNYDADWTDISSTSSSLSYTVSGLTDGSAYKFKVRARNASGFGAESDESDAATPRAVTLTAGTVTATGMTLTIAGHNAAWYWKRTAPTAGDCSSEVAAGTDSATVGSLDSNTAWTFKAYSDNGCETELAAAAPVATLPPKPAKPAATTGAGSGKLTLTSWVTGTAALTKWQYKKSKDGGNYDADWTDISSTSKTLSHTVSGLTDGSAYRFKVRARNASGFGAASGESDATTPRAPTLTAGTATATGMTLTIAHWSGAWYHEYSTPAGGDCSTEVAAGTKTATVGSLDSNTAYTFKAYSDSQCTTELASAAAYATLPPAPAKPTLTLSLGSGKVKLASSVTGTAALTKWQYKKKKDAGNYDADWTDISSTSKTLSHTVSGLTDGSAYKFKVRARNASGFGAESGESDAATPRAPTLTAGTATATGMTLTVANWSGAWRWKRTAPTVGDCSSEVAAGTSTATVGSLGSNTAWTFKAYSDGSCSTELAAASPVATLPPAPSKPTLTLSLGSGKVRVSSSVTGTAALTKWQYKKKKDGGDYDADWTDISSTSKTLSHTVSGLTDGSAYKFKVRARNASGFGAASDESDAATPRAVTLTAGTATATGMTLTIANWSGAWRWKRTAPSAGDCSSEVAAGTSTATVGSLGSNTAWTFKAYSDGSCSTELAAASPVATLPPAPSKPTLTLSLGSGKVRVSSSVTGTAAIEKWQYKKKKDGGSYDADWTDISSTSSSLSHTVSGLTDGSAYKFKVRARNASGFGAASGESDAATPRAPTLTAGTATATGMTLTIGHWSGAWYWKHTSPSDGDCSTEVAAGTSSATVGGLDKGTTYTFKAYGDNACSDDKVLATAASLATKPDKVSGVQAGARDSALAVSWTAVTGATSYKVQWKTSSQQWDSTNRELVSTTTSKTIPTLVNDTQYTVRVAASTSGGDGAWSDTTTGTPNASGITLSALTPAAVPEGGSATYTVVLDVVPSHAVTIAVANRGQSADDSDLTVSPASLSFGTTNWNAPQTVTVTAKQDSDTANGSAVITHTPTSTDANYNDTVRKTVAEADDDAHGVVVSETAVSVPEGGSAVWTVRLASLPSATVYVDMAKQSGGDADLTFSPAQLTFTTKGWDLPQQVTVSAAQDTDAARGTATITHTATSTDTSYGSSLTIASVTATEDDDELGVTVSKKVVSVPEGGSATWTVVLDGPPTQNVTIAVAKKTGGDGNLTASPASLTFTSTNWSSAQTVTASAAQDVDETDGTATFTHTATSTDTDFNGLAIASVAATEDDDDASGVTLSKTSVSVTEGSTATYTVVLDTAPTQNVTIAVAKQSGGDADLTVSPASLTFTGGNDGNWASAQTVTVTAAEDNTDDANGTATFTHTASSTDTDYGSSLTIASVTATEADNDTLAGVTVSKTSVSVTEGSTATYTVVLDTAPTANVTIAVAKQSGGDADLTVSPASLTFTSTNWNQAQTVTVTAAEDADDADGTATITHTATSTDASYGGIAIASVAATEADTAPASADLTLVVSRDNRTAIPLRDLPFTGEGGATLYGVKIVTLPGASHGTLGLVKTGIYTGAATVLCVGSITPVTAGQVVVDALSTVLYFCPEDGFTHTTFAFQVVDSQGRTSGAPRTATLVGPPGQVTGVAAEAGNGYVRLSWTDPGNSSITGYEYRQRSGAGVTTWGAWQAMTGSGATTTSWSVSGLTNGTAYTFQVRAKSAGGTGAIPSAAVGATPSASKAPAKPTGFAGATGTKTCTVSGTDHFCVHLFWDDPLDPSITRWEVERAAPSAPSTWVKGSLAWSNNRVPDSGASTTSAVVAAGAANAGPYKFRVRAVNATGEGPWSDEVSVVVGSGDAKPILLAPAAGNGRVALRWRYYGAQSTTCGTSCWDVNGAAIAGSGKDLRAHTVTDLTNGQTYTYKVRTYVDKTGSSNTAGPESNQVSITLPAAPAKPAGLTVKGAPSGAALSWTDPKNAVITGWQYRRKAGVGAYGSWTRVPGSAAGTTSASVSGLTNGTEHKFQVRAVIEYETALGGALAGAASDEVSVTPVGVVVSKDRLALTEGGAAGAYTVKLSQAPTHNVTITVSVDGDGTVTADTDDGTTGNQATLTFTTTNYATAQTVKVKAAADADGRDSTATITHTASSTDARYGALVGIPGLTVAVTDSNAAALGIVLSTASVSVAEGSTATYTVKLGTKPTSAVTVTIARASGGDTDLAIVDTDPGATGTQNTIEFSTTNYATARTVTVRAAEDNGDVTAGTATFTHTAAGGGYGNVAAATLAAAETDNDTGIVLTPATLSVPEEGSATYTVKLGTQPGADVTVTIAKASGGDEDLTAAPSSLTFTGGNDGNWGSAQTVTVSAADDGDEVDGTATFTHTASGAGSGYAGASASLAAAEADNDRSIVLSVSTVALTEGGATGSYTVALSSAPNADVTVAVSSGDTGAVTASPSSLTFTSTNYSSMQTVTLTAVNDGDGADESVTVSNTASGGGYDVSGDVTVSVDDDDQGLTLSKSTVSVTEGSTATYTVRLAAAPNADVTVTIAHAGGDSDLTVSPTSLTFSATNSATAQTVTVSAAEDDNDVIDGTASFTHTASGGGYGNVTAATLTATEADDDTGIVLTPATLSVPEGGTNTYTVKLGTQPGAGVTVAIARASGGDSDLTVSPASLTFTTSNYSSVQTVTVSAAEDDGDNVNGTATFTHTASGAGSGYGGASASLAATEADNERRIVLSVSTVSLTEGGSTGSYTVALSAAPDANVTVAVSSGDTGAVRASPSSLTFSTTNYATVRTVTLTAVGDADGADESVTVSNTSSGGGYDASGDVTVSVDDDDQGLTLSASTVSLTEGGSTGSYTVRLAAAPNADVTVAVSSADTGAVRASPSSLTFSTTNYASVQTVTLTVVGDADGADESVTVSNTASGGGYDASAGVTATVDDDDQGLTLSASTVSLTEGGSTGSYTVALAAAPSGDVTVAVSSGDTGAVTVSPSSLTFSTTNHASVQTVTLTAVGDADGADESVTVSNSATGGGYDVSAGVTAAVDDDEQGLTLSVASVKVAEGGTQTYTVKLAAQPSGTVTVAIAKAAGGDADLTVNRSTLRFGTTNYASAQTVTVRAAEETGEDSANGTATFTHTATGGGYDVSADLAAKELDNDRVVGIPATLRVPEGGTATYTVKLAVAPSADVTLTLAVSGDSDLTVDADDGAQGAQDTLTFSDSNYATARTVTVAAAQDGDFADGAATISHAAASSDADYDAIPIPGVRATEADDDTPPPISVAGVTLSSSNVTVPEGATATYTVALATRPDAVVTVTLTRAPGGDADLTVDTDPGTPGAQSTLVFVPARWNLAQTVTIAAALDDDRLDGTATFTHTAAGGGYDDVSATLTAVEADDNRRIVLSASSLTAPEGGVATYTVKLAGQPSDAVTVTLTRSPGGDADLTVDTDPSTAGAQRTLVFTPADFGDARTVTVSAAPDADGVDGTATFTHTAAGGGYGGVSATLAAAEADDDRRIVLSPSRLTVPEGLTATYEVALASRPSRAVTVTLARDAGGDADLTVDTDPDTADAQRTLVFTPADWSDARTVTVAAAVDADEVDGTATFTHTAAGGIWTGVSAALAVAEEDEPAPVAVGALPSLSLVAGGAPRTVDVSGAFRGSNLSYAVHSSREASVAASIEGAVVTLTPLRGGEARITVSARNRIGEARQSFTATVGADPAERRAVEDGLAAIGRGMLSGIEMVLGARLRGESSEGVRIAGYALESGDIEAAPHAEKGSPPDAAQGSPPDAVQGFWPDAGHGREEESADVDWLDGTTSFVVALNAGAGIGADAGEEADLAPRWTLWGQGDLQSFSASRSSIDGETRTAWLGLDTAWGDDWLLGTAVSYGEGHADYAFEGGSGSGSGRLRTTLTSLHPYLRWRPWEDGTVWVALGVGSGEVENRRDHVGRVERGDLSMFTAWGSGRYDLRPDAGGADLALLGDLAFLRMRTDTGSRPGSLDAVSSAVGRLRLGLEGSWKVRMESGELSPFAQVSARHDSGDGETGNGMEVSGGVRYGSGRVSFETGARMLWVGGGDYEESGWNVALALEPREAGRGLSMSLSPTWGAAQHRALEALWRPDALSVLDDGAAPAGDGVRTQIGYGLRWPASSSALLTPYAEHDSFSSGERRTSTGVRLELPSSGLEVDLRGEFEEGAGGAAGGSGVYLDVGVRF